MKQDGKGICGPVKGRAVSQFQFMQGRKLLDYRLGKRWLMGSGAAIGRPQQKGQQPVSKSAQKRFVLHFIPQLPVGKDYAFVRGQLQNGRLTAHAAAYGPDVAAVAASQLLPSPGRKHNGKKSEVKIKHHGSHDTAAAAHGAAQSAVGGAVQVKVPALEFFTYGTHITEDGSSPPAGHNSKLGLSALGKFFIQQHSGSKTQ